MIPKEEFVRLQEGAVLVTTRELHDSMDGQPNIPSGSLVRVVGILGIGGPLPSAIIETIDGPLIRHRGWSWVEFNKFDLRTSGRRFILKDIPSQRRREFSAAAMRAGYTWPQPTLIHPSIGLDLDGRIYHSPRGWDFGWPTALVLSAETHWSSAMSLIGQPSAPGAKQTIEQILPADVLSILRNSPANPQLRGLIRAATNRPVPREVLAEGSGPTIAWLLEAVNGKEETRELIGPPIPAPVQPGAEPAPPPGFPPQAQAQVTAPRVPRVYQVECNYVERETLQAIVQRDRVYRGTLSIPEAALADCTTTDELREAIEGYCNGEYYTLNSETGNAEITEIEDCVEQENAAQDIAMQAAVEAYMRDNPEQFVDEHEEE